MKPEQNERYPTITQMSKSIKNNTENDIQQEDDNNKEEWHFKDNTPSERFLVRRGLKNVSDTTTGSNTVERPGIRFSINESEVLTSYSPWENLIVQ